MKYQAHLKTGAIIDVELSGELPNLFGGEARALVTEWLVDDNGAMLNMAHVAALVPVLDDAAKTPFVPDIIMDDDGDKWTLYRDGLYHYSDGTTDHVVRPRTRAEVESSYGIREEW
jgi:hypothetical protein